MCIMDLIQNRHSTRKFKDKPVKESVLQDIIEAGRLAPSAKNRQPWRFVVVNEKPVIKRIAEAAYGQEAFTDVPCVIAGCTTNTDYRMPNGQDAYPVDIAAAMSFMMLQAEAGGLGTCFISTYDEREVKEILTIPYSMRVVLLLLAGYSDEEPPPRKRLPLDRIAGFNHW